MNADTVTKRWGKLIRDKRKHPHLNLTQADLAEALTAYLDDGTEVVQSHVSCWETFRYAPSHRYQAALINVLGVADNEIAAIYRRAA